MTSLRLPGKRCNRFQRLPQFTGCKDRSATRWSFACLTLGGPARLWTKIFRDSVNRVIGSTARRLDEGDRVFMERRIGYDFSNVRVHADAAAARSASDLGARAYTVGNEIVFGAGEYQPGAAGYRRLLAHELTHVVQQGGLAPGRQDKLNVGPENDPLGA